MYESKNAGKINNLIAWHDSEDCVLVHGDFHWDNLLEDENGDILLCDWQGVNLGGASGDMSFFLSRLGADGIRIDTEIFLDSYVNAVWELSGKQMKRQDITLHMSAAGGACLFTKNTIIWSAGGNPCPMQNDSDKAEGMGQE